MQSSLKIELPTNFFHSNRIMNIMHLLLCHHQVNSFYSCFDNLYIFSVRIFSAWAYQWRKYLLCLKVCEMIWSFHCLWDIFNTSWQACLNCFWSVACGQEFYLALNPIFHSPWAQMTMHCQNMHVTEYCVELFCRKLNTLPCHVPILLENHH